MAKYIEHEPIFAPGRKDRFKVVRETKTQYIVKINDVAFWRFSKNHNDVDGSLVDRIPRPSFSDVYTLRITED